MKIAVIGSGKIGGTLARQWGAAGHEITFGVRDPAKAEVQQLVGDVGSNARATSIDRAVADGEVVLFAVPGAAMAATVASLGPALDGKLIIDATNNIGADVTNSVAAIQAAAPTAHVYRAFNTYGFENFAEPRFDGVQADLFYAGPEGEPQARAERLIADVGLRPVRLGGPERAELVDALLRVWFALAIEQQRGRRLAFKLLTR
jgi:8-hydroxy-5-deazaflavin:NADPH oxidoreductase